MLNCSTAHPPMSSLNVAPVLSEQAKVYDLDFLRSEARHLSIIPTYPNIARIRRAFDLVENHRVRLTDRFGDVRVYEVHSQSRDRVHLVVANGDNRCTCEDARRHPNFSGCKHSIAVQIYEERMADYDDYLQWLEVRPLH